MTAQSHKFDGLQKELQNLLKKDLAGFADPGMSVTVEEAEQNWVRAEWVIRGERRSASFQLGGSADLRDVVVRVESSTDISYRSFLAGTEMANLRRLSTNIVNLARDGSSYVAPNAVLENSLDEDLQEISADALVRQISKNDDGRTNVVFLTAQAGVGKTSLLQHVVHTVATDYRSGQAEALWLYVDAQGRRLAKLDDAISGELGKLRAQFSFDAVASLVRVGCIVLVVDGFDELLGIQGSYDESFSSLASFLDELQSSGCVVAAARSAYYEQEFVGRVNSAIGFRTDGWVVNRVRLQLWNADQLDLYVEKRAEEEGLSPAQVSDVKAKISTAFASDSVSHLRGMPFFVSRVTDVILKGSTLSSGTDLLEQLVNSYVSREAEEKLRDAGHSYLTPAQLREVFSEIAEEMWRQDTRELSRTSLREVLEVWLDVAGLPSEAQLAIVDRGPYSALLQSADKGAVKFEHDVYYSYFLAGPIVELTRKGDPLPLRQALRRSNLPVEAANMAGARLRTHATDRLTVLMTACERQDASTEQVRQNAGTVAAGIMRAHDGAFEGVEIRLLRFVDCDLSKVTLRESTLRDCIFTGSDLQNFRLMNCLGERLSFERVGVDPSTTLLDVSRVPVNDFRALRLIDDASDITVYDPRRVSEILAECGLPEAQVPIPLRPVNVEIVDLLEKLSWLFSKTNYFTEQDGTADVRRVVQHAHWRTTRNAMIDAEVLSWSKRQTSGNKKFLRVHVPPNDLMAGQDSQATVVPVVRTLWDSLESLFPEETSR
ncbi:NACHT domain-containing protein [Streptomyces sp. GMR22]|uniref:NACHT domain-containing protein n=1 Tax=Streptomyces sp. GMR22 TaxID=2759524 RepID=UPI0015FD4CCB|nr:NACHT domain-containing protein [Streptomyces sp. GMR22]MBA6439678.1 NACHT domain-containing protein [Streptomyces sp. GMR22]